VFNPLNLFLGLFSLDIGIDLGTANTLVYVRNKGIIINEPSWVAIDKRTKRVLAIGSEAKEMVGRTPAHIVAVRPLRDGVISEFDITENMLHYFIGKAHDRLLLAVPRPRVVVGIPSGVTEVAVFSLGGIVVSRSIRIAGDEMDEDIIAYARQKYNLLIGERMAERVKMTIGSAYPLPEEQTMTLRGRNLVTGLPEAIEVSSIEIREALSGSVSIIVDTVKSALDETPPELVADLMESGIYLAGGGALLQGLAERLSDETKMRVQVAEDPMTCVARGAGKVLEDLDTLSKVLASTQRRGTRR